VKSLYIHTHSANNSKKESKNIKLKRLKAITPSTTTTTLLSSRERQECGFVHIKKQKIRKETKNNKECVFYTHTHIQREREGFRVDKREYKMTEKNHG